MLLAPDVRANTISMPIKSRIIPPAVRKEAIDIPRTDSKASPNTAKTSKTIVATVTALTAVRFRFLSEYSEVSAAKIAEISIGLTVANSVASVIAAISTTKPSFR